MRWGKKKPFTYGRKRSLWGGGGRRSSLISSSRKPFFRNGYIVLNTILFSGILGIGLFLLFSPRYAIKNIQIIGLEYVSPNELLAIVNDTIDEQRILWMSHRNIFMTSEKRIRSAIEGRYLFNSLEVSKKYPESLAISIKEKNIQYRVRSANHEYLVDDKGVVVEQFRNFNQRPSLLQLVDVTTQDLSANDILASLSSFDDSDRFPLLYLEQDAGFQLGGEAIDENRLKFLQELIAKKEIPYGTINLIILPASNPEYVTLRMEDGWLAILNTRDTITSQLEDMRLVIERQIGKDKLKRLEKIDLRLGGNIYYKMK